jgi:N-carbamoylputrescine amidase
LIQTRCSPDPAENFARAAAKISQSRPARGAHHLHPGTFHLPVFLPEREPRLFQTGRTHSRPVHRRLAKTGPPPPRRHHRLALREARGRRLSQHRRHHRCRRQLLGIYRKMHIPDDPLYYEKFYFTPGDLGFRSWKTRRGKIGVCICWDQWYPEAARLTAMQGAQILFYPTAIGWHPVGKERARRQSARRLGNIQRSHAVANGCFVAAVNRVGLEKPAGGDGIEFWGQSFVAAPSGQILAKRQRRAGGNPPVPVDLGKSMSRARTGPSCATAASTPTAICPNASSIEPRRHSRAGEGLDHRGRRPHRQLPRPPRGKIRPAFKASR